MIALLARIFRRDRFLRIAIPSGIFYASIRDDVGVDGRINIYRKRGRTAVAHKISVSFPPPPPLFPSLSLFY